MTTEEALTEIKVTRLINQTEYNQGHTHCEKCGKWITIDEAKRNQVQVLDGPDDFRLESYCDGCILEAEERGYR